MDPLQVLTRITRCDADPTVLSDYVLALLKHDEPESQLRTGLEKQLAEFLEAGLSIRLILLVGHSLISCSCHS